tara:strand:+ start:34 stop:297 length:264 start_codon:yes stop_codon:yes gene_type:complete
MATDYEKEIDKWRKKARKFEKLYKEATKDNQDLETFTMYLQKKILRLTDDEEKGMYLTQKLNEFHNLSIDQKLKHSMNDANAIRENK